jgi:hypothetical protein
LLQLLFQLLIAELQLLDRAGELADLIFQALEANDQVRVGELSRHRLLPLVLTEDTVEKSRLRDLLRQRSIRGSAQGHGQRRASQRAGSERGHRLTDTLWKTDYHTGPSKTKMRRNQESGVSNQ